MLQSRKKKQSLIEMSYLAVDVTPPPPPPPHPSAPELKLQQFLKSISYCELKE